LRKGYKVFGAVEFFTGRLIYQGTEQRFQSDSYQSFLRYLLSQVSGRVILIQDGARYHTSKATREFIAQYKERLTVSNYLLIRRTTTRSSIFGRKSKLMPLTIATSLNSSCL
jgi:hypothetical protein